jgi:hypothetical protein
MSRRGVGRIEGTCAIAGSLVLLLGTYLHPMSAGPNGAVAAFTEYAADRLWVASHLTQLAGVTLTVAAQLARERRRKHRASVESEAPAWCCARVDRPVLVAAVYVQTFGTEVLGPGDHFRN